MSLFFDESVNKNNKENNNQIFVEDASGTLAVALDAEASWNNIMSSMIKTEAMCTLNEDSKGLGEATKNFFEKMKQFFVDLWNKFVAALKNLQTKLYSHLNIGKAVLKKYELRARSFNNGDVSANIFQWKYFKIGSLANSKVISIASKLQGIVKSSADKGAMSTDEIAKEAGFGSASAMDGEIVASTRSESKADVKLNRELVDTAISNIKQFKVTIKKLNDLASNMKVIISLGKDSAEAGLKEDTASDKNKKYGNVVRTAKAASFVASKLINVFIKLAEEIYFDSAVIVKKAASSVGKKDVTKETGLANVKKEEVKKESLENILESDLYSVDDLEKLDE